MITKKFFGTAPDGSDVYAYCLSNDSIVSANICNFGGTVINLWVEDRNGEKRDVVCGFDDLDGYLTSGGYQGAIIGRVTNRISNSKFTLDGKEYLLYPNCGTFTAHGGKTGFNKRVWGARSVDGDEPMLILTYVSPDMEENYPGTIVVTVTYTLTKCGALKVNYEAYTDKRTIINLTNHSYFNLEGYESASIADQVMWIDADTMNEQDFDIIPTGNIISVKGTPYDFTSPKAIGRDFDSDLDMEKQNGGYDNNFIFNNYDGSLKKRCSLKAPLSGIEMTVYTDQPCVGVYTSNMMNENDPPFKGGVVQKNRCAVCFETQKMPDAINNPSFTDTVLEPGEIYTHTTVFAFNH
ncbi:MAG: galactose mutarotase [Ruminococcaceae bacterium]|nr:galactose mutarotase [Oscillospiraceae bacterium]